MARRLRIAFGLDLKWPYKRHTSVFAGAQEYAQQHGWETIIDEFADNSRSGPAGKSMRYDGVIARASRSLHERMSHQETPLVNVWASSPARDLIHGVFPDFAESGRLRANHLLDRGFRNFATLSRNRFSEQLEASEFRRQVSADGHSCNSLTIPHQFTDTEASWLKVKTLINKWMDSWKLPIGVIVSRDLLGRIVAQKCLAREWLVPQQVGIVTGQNETAICEQPRPSLSSVELGYEQVGYQAAKMLDKLIADRKNVARRKTKPAIQHILIPPLSLIVRESSDFYTVDDEVVAAALSYIAANSHHDIRAQDVADAVATGVKTLQNRFQNALSRTISKTIRLVRIERAKRELTQSQRSISEIARNAGFTRAERMNEVFQRELGISPSQFRKQSPQDGA